jgi:hypothetical protein
MIADFGLRNADWEEQKAVSRKAVDSKNALVALCLLLSVLHSAIRNPKSAIGKPNAVGTT